MSAEALLHIGTPTLEDDVHGGTPLSARNTMRHPPGRPGLRPHIRLLRGSRQLVATYCPSPGPGDIWSPGGAGLTSKPHRDQSTRSRLTWAVLPAAGIGLRPRARGGGRAAGAAPPTARGGAQDTTAPRPGREVGGGGGKNPPPGIVPE